MVSFIEFVLYLSPPAALVIAGLGALWISYISGNPIYLLFAAALFYFGYRLYQHSLKVLDRIANRENKAKVKIAQARLAATQHKRALETEKVQHGWVKVSQKLAGKIIKDL